MGRKTTAPTEVRDIKGGPILQHNCGCQFMPRYLSMRHGKLQIEPQYCMRCGLKFYLEDLEPVNDTARGRLIFLGLRSDPNKKSDLDNTVEF